MISEQKIQAKLEESDSLTYRWELDRTSMHIFPIFLLFCETPSTHKFEFLFSKLLFISHRKENEFDFLLHTKLREWCFKCIFWIIGSVQWSESYYGVVGIWFWILKLLTKFFNRVFDLLYLQVSSQFLACFWLCIDMGSPFDGYSLWRVIPKCVRSSWW